MVSLYGDYKRILLPVTVFLSAAPIRLFKPSGLCFVGMLPSKVYTNSNPTFRSGSYLLEAECTLAPQKAAKKQKE